MGMIESSWKRCEYKLSWTVEIPVGSSADLRVQGNIISVEGAIKVKINEAENINDAMGSAQKITLGCGKYKIISEIARSNAY